MTSIQALKYYSIAIIPIVMSIILINTVKTDRPFYLMSSYHFNLVEQSKVNSNSSIEHKKLLVDFSNSFK